MLCRLPNIKSGGEAFQPPLPICFTNLLLLHQHAKNSAHTNLSAKSCFALSKPMAFFHLFLSPEKGGRGRRTGEDDLASDTSLVHSLLQVRGGVSLGQYYSTVRAIDSSCVYIRIIISLGCRPPRRTRSFRTKFRFMTPPSGRKLPSKFPSH